MAMPMAEWVNIPILDNCSDCGDGEVTASPSYGLDG